MAWVLPAASPRRPKYDDSFFWFAYVFSYSFGKCNNDLNLHTTFCVCVCVSLSTRLSLKIGGGMERNGLEWKGKGTMWPILILLQLLVANRFVYFNMCHVPVPFGTHRAIIAIDDGIFPNFFCTSSFYLFVFVPNAFFFFRYVPCFFPRWWLLLLFEI